MVEPLVVSPSGVDAIALGDNAAFEHDGVLVQHDGIGAGEVGRSLAFVRDPRFVGAGFFAGEAPDGLTTVYGDPIPADVFVYWRDPDDPMAQEVLVGATKSAPDGTWCITGLNYNLQYVIRARASGRDDVTVVGVQPSRADVITYEGEFTNTEDFDGVAGEILITSGLPPFTATVIQPLPSGLSPVVSGRNLIIDGTTNADEEASFDVKVTSSNGAEKIIPLQLVVGFKAPQKLESEVIVDYDVFSVALTWEVASSTQQVKVYRSETPFDMDDLPVPLAVLTGSATTYTDDDVVEDEAFYYMVSAEREGYARYSVVVREVVVTGDPHWDKVVALLHFDGGLTDEANPGRVWRGSYVASPQPGVGGSSALDKSSRIYVPDSANNLPTPWVFYGEPCTLEFFLRRDSPSDAGNIISLWPSNIRFECQISNSNLVFTAFIGTTRTMTFGLPFIDSNLEHIAIVREGNGIFSAFRQGVKLSQTYGPYSGAVHAGTGGNVTAGGVTFDELRITKGVARYTADFTPPTAPFPSR